MGSRRVPAVFADVALAAGTCGVELSFRPLRPDPLPDRVRDLADLGPDPSVTGVRGLGKVLRLLRAARIARPDDPRRLLGRPEQAVALLERAVGTIVALRIRPRSEVRFLAWTERGVEAVGGVSDVLEGGDAWIVLRRNGRPPVRIARDAVIRTRTQCETWYEILDIQSVDSARLRLAARACSSLRSTPREIRDSLNDHRPGQSHPSTPLPSSSSFPCRRTARPGPEGSERRTRVGATKSSY